MAGQDRMTIEEVVRKVLRDEHADVIRESVKAVARGDDGGRGVRADRRRARRAPARGPRDAPQRLSAAALGHPGRGDRVADPQAAPGQLLPERSCSRASAPSRRWSRWCSRPMCAASRRAASISWSRASGCGSRKCEVSRIAGLLDEQVQAFRERPLEGRYPYLFVDAKIEKVRDGGRVQRKCVVIAHAVHETGRREIIGLDVGAAETEAFWREFLRGLVARGLVGVQLAISDAHPGLKAALAQVLGAPWQRCTVHFLRDLRGHVRTRPARRAGRDHPLDLHRRRRRAGARSACATPSASSSGGCRRSPPCSKKPKTTCSPSTRSRPSTGPSCAPRTRWSASTARSAGAPTSSASSPTTPA